MNEDIYEFTEMQLPNGSWGLLFAYVPGNLFKAGDKIFVDSWYQYQEATVISVTNYNGWQDVLTTAEQNGEEFFNISNKPLTSNTPSAPVTQPVQTENIVYTTDIEPETLAEPDYSNDETELVFDEVVNDVLEQDVIAPVQPRNNLLKYVIIALGAIVLFNFFKK